LLRAHKSLPEIFQDLLGDFDLHLFPETQMVQFSCPCSVHRVLGALKLLGQKELQDMIEKDEGAEATCEFCQEIYQVNSDQLTELIEDLQTNTGS
jgi:molecular chaperone Hsp33